MKEPSNPRPRDWAKLWMSWYTSPSHEDLTQAGIAVGPPLILLANRSKSWGSVQPTSKLHVAKLAANLLRSRIEFAEKGIAELEQTGTVVVGADGSISFPNFASWQETPDAQRKRQARARSRRNVGVDNGQSADCPRTVRDTVSRARSGSGSLSGSGSSDSEEGVQGEGPPPESRLPVRAPPLSLGPPDSPAFDATDVIMAWEESRTGGMLPQLILGSVEGHAIAELRQPLEFWQGLFERAAESPFLRGEISGFRASLRWVVQNHAKVLAGSYDGRRGSQLEALIEKTMGPLS